MSVVLLFLAACQSRVFVEVDHYERNGEPDKAEALLMRHLETNPNEADTHFRLGELHGRMQKYGQMLYDFSAAEKHDGRLREKIANRKESYWRESFNRGVTALNRNEPQNAITPLRHAVLILPERYVAYPVLAAALLATPDSSGTLSILEKACALNEDDLESRHALLQLYYAAGKNPEALKLSEAILKKSPHDLSALRCRALVLQRQQPGQSINPVQAEAAFQELLRQSNDPDDRLAFAMYYYRQQRYAQAIPWFQEALNRRSSPPSANDSSNSSSVTNLHAIRLGGRRAVPIEELYRYLGDCAWHVGDYTAMSSWYTHLLQIHPNDISALQNLLIAAQALGKQDDAEFIKKQLNQLTGGHE